jgi:transcriptional regulator with XRE-family HTH domain
MSLTAIGNTKGRLARALGARMSELGLTLRQVAERTGLTYEHIRKLVKGEAYPSKLALREVCRVLDLDIATMETLAVADRVESKYGGIPHALAGKHPELSLLAPWWDLLTPEQKDSFRVQIRSVAEANQKVPQRKPVKSVSTLPAITHRKRPPH